MPLSKVQIDTLLSLVKTGSPDDVDCDGCFEKIAEFAEIELAGNEIPEALQNIRQHIDQCPCCRDEYEALKVGLESLSVQ